MEISACPNCGSRKIFQGKLKEGILTGITTKYVCRNCGYQGFPILFDNEKEYKKFIEQFDDIKKPKKEIKQSPEKTNETSWKENIPIKLGLGLIIVGLLLSAGTLSNGNLSFYINFTAILIIDGIGLILVGILSPKQIDFKKIKNYPKISGIILIISGIIFLIIFLLMLLLYYNYDNPIVKEQLSDTISKGNLFYISFSNILFSFFTIIGGVFAILKKNWGLAVIGSILGTLILFPYYIASLICLIALICLSFSKELFKKS